MAPMLDYTQFAEMACQEEDAVYSSYPSKADVIGSGGRFVDPGIRPADPLAVPYAYYMLAIALWGAYGEARWEVFGEWYHYKSCPYCGTTLQHVEGPAASRFPVERVEFRLCRGCGWWDAEESLVLDQEAGSNHYVAKSIHRRPVLREFSVGAGDAPLEGLIRHIASHPDELRDISPRQLEDLVGAVFGEYMDCEAIHVGGPNDEGVDLLLVGGDQKYAVQVKRRYRDAAEAVSGVREFIGAMLLQGIIRGLFVTTANRYSPQAEAAARKAEEKGIVECIKLYDATKLVDVCKLQLNAGVEPWEQACMRDDDVSSHTSSGYDAFLELQMGHPDWGVEGGSFARYCYPDVDGCHTWAEQAARYRAAYLQDRA